MNSLTVNLRWASHSIHNSPSVQLDIFGLCAELTIKCNIRQNLMICWLASALLQSSQLHQWLLQTFFIPLHRPTYDMLEYNNQHNQFFHKMSLHQRVNVTSIIAVSVDRRYLLTLELSFAKQYEQWEQMTRDLQRRSALEFTAAKAKNTGSKLDSNFMTSLTPHVKHCDAVCPWHMTATQPENLSAMVGHGQWLSATTVCY